MIFVPSLVTLKVMVPEGASAAETLHSVSDAATVRTRAAAASSPGAGAGALSVQAEVASRPTATVGMRRRRITG